MNSTSTATLYILSGLPGSGKSTLAKDLAKKLKAQWLRIDSIEQTLKDQGFKGFYDTGYRVAFALAKDNLALGLDVIADSVNDCHLSRRAWHQVAEQTGANFVDIEISCSDKTEHKYRVESRHSEVLNLTLPSWQQVQDRDYEPWQQAVLRLDTAGLTVQEATTELINKLSELA